MSELLVRKKFDIFVLIIFIILAFCFLWVKQYPLSFLMALLIFVVIAPGSLKLLKLKIGSGGIEAICEKAQEEKIKKDIRENKEKITSERIEYIRDIENRIIRNVHKKLGGELKRQIHFVYGDRPEKPEFIFNPDATIKVGKELIFIEIKHVNHLSLAKAIINSGIQQLQSVLDKFKYFAGADFLKAKLIIATKMDLDISDIKTPNDISIEIFKY